MFRSSITSNLRAPARSFSTSSVARAGFTNATFIGNIGSDISVTEAASGRKYVKYSIAVNQRKGQPSQWFPITAFSEPQINFMAEYIKKGALVHVEASPQSQVLEAEDGSKKQVFSFIQRQITLLKSGHSEGGEHDDL